MRTIPSGYKVGTFRWGQFTVIVSIDDDLWHMSISLPRRDLTYEEIKKARYRFIPNSVTMALMFPPKEQFLNYHEHCFQLWEVPTEEWSHEDTMRTQKVNKAAAKIRASERSERRDNSDAFR